MEDRLPESIEELAAALGLTIEETKAKSQHTLGLYKIFQGGQGRWWYKLPEGRYQPLFLATLPYGFTLVSHNEADMQPTASYPEYV